MFNPQNLETLTSGIAIGGDWSKRGIETTPFGNNGMVLHNKITDTDFDTRWQSQERTNKGFIIKNDNSQTVWTGITPRIFEPYWDVNYFQWQYQIKWGFYIPYGYEGHDTTDAKMYT